MTNRTLTLWLSCCLAVFLGTPGCSGDADTGDRGATGSLSLSLELANGAEIDEVLYKITAEGMDLMNGAIDTSAPGATASIEVFGLPPGPGYVVELRAVANDGTSCEGSAPFAVSAGGTTSVMVMLSCKPPQRFGSVRVNGELNVCAHLEKVVVAPLQTSVGGSIDLSAQGADAEDDDVDYRWFASGGSISNPNGPITQYTCEDAGPHLIRAEVSDDGFDCIDAWTVEVRCVGSLPECVPTQSRCSNGEIEPIVEDPECMLEEPPSLPNGCTGTESVLNPASCTATGVVSTHQTQVIAVAPDCNTGFDLDYCDGTTCQLGGLAPGEGIDGVDNALTALAPLLAAVDGNLGGVDQAFYDGLCDGSIDWVFQVDANPTEGCLTVLPVYGGVPADPVRLNLSSTGCVSGTLGTIPLPVAGVEGALGNATVRGTADAASGFDVILGATVDDETAVAIAEALLEGAGAIVSQVFDIDDDLEGGLGNACNSLSLTFDVAGNVVDGGGESACTDAENAAVYDSLEYLDGNGTTHTGTDAASAIASDCVFGSANSEPMNPGCGQEAQAVLICGGQGCPPETIQALADCVQACTQDLIEEVTGDQLSEDCAYCYGESVACSAAFCATAGCTNPSSASCIQCRCDEGCTPGFDVCSGIPPSGDCNGTD